MRRRHLLIASLAHAESIMEPLSRDGHVVGFAVQSVNPHDCAAG